MRVAQLRKALDFWLARADPDGAEGADAHHHAARGVHLSRTFEGMWRLDGQLTPEAGQILADALDRRVRELFAAARAQADAEGTAVSVTYPQLRADALVELATQAVTAAEHGGGLNVPAITALVDLAKLTDVHTCAGEPVGETDQGDKVTAEQARRLTCDCSLSRIVFDPNGATIDLGESRAPAEPGHAPRDHRPRPHLRVPRLRHPRHPHPRPPPRPLDEGRADRPRQPRQPLQQTSPRRPRGRLRAHPSI